MAQDDILIALDSEQRVMAIMLHLLATFDTINHEMLVLRLQTRFGIQGIVIPWFQSYLMDHYQVLNVSGEAYESVLLIYVALLQRSVLGPLEFTAYMSPSMA